MTLCQITHTQSSNIHSLAHILDTCALIFSSCALFTGRRTVLAIFMRRFSPSTKEGSSCQVTHIHRSQPHLPLAHLRGACALSSVVTPFHNFSQPHPKLRKFYTPSCASGLATPSYPPRIVKQPPPVYTAHQFTQLLF